MAAKKKKKAGKAIKSGVLANEVVLCFIPMHNSHGKKDVTYAFRPEAEEFARLCREGSKVIEIDNSLPFRKRQAAVLDAITMESHAVGDDFYTTVAFFCHGWDDGIQLGFKRSSVGKLADAILSIVPDNDVNVPLFCCSTGEDPEDDSITAAGTGDGSFADKLRDALCQAGSADCRVMGHTTVAHTTSNPMVLFMDGMGVPDGGVGGYPPVSPKSKNWGAWKKALRDRKNNTLRFRMPFMKPADIHAELKA